MMNFLNLSTMSLDASSPDYSLIDEPLQFPFYHVHRESVFPGISDGIASLLVTVLVYWVVSLSYHYLDISGWQWLEKYRIQESDEVKSRNLVTRGQVVRTVAFQQCMQTAFGIAWLILFPVPPPARNYALELRGLSLKLARYVFMIMGEQQGRLFVEKFGSSLTYSMYWWIIPMAQYFFALCARSFFSPLCSLTERLLTASSSTRINTSSTVRSTRWSSSTSTSTRCTTACTCPSPSGHSMGTHLKALSLTDSARGSRTPSREWLNAKQSSYLALRRTRRSTTIADIISRGIPSIWLSGTIPTIMISTTRCVNHSLFTGFFRWIIHTFDCARVFLFFFFTASRD